MVESNTAAAERKLPYTAADAVCLRQTASGEHEILLITRLKKTFQGCFAFPGGHIDYGEDPEVACTRELEEETGVKGTLNSLLCVRGKGDRDPRYHMISIVYMVDVAEDAEPVAMDDAASAAWYPIKEVIKTPEKWAFDHHSIVMEMIGKHEEKFAYCK